MELENMNEEIKKLKNKVYNTLYVKVRRFVKRNQKETAELEQVRNALRASLKTVNRILIRKKNSIHREEELKQS